MIRVSTVLFDDVMRVHPSFHILEPFFEAIIDGVFDVFAGVVVWLGARRNFDVFGNPFHNQKRLWIFDVVKRDSSRTIQKLALFCCFICERRFRNKRVLDV